MKCNGQYSIGEVSQICNVSKKALRHYDKMGLINSERSYTNNYRYYSDASLLAVPVIKYYKQMGFKLEEMREFIEGDNVYKALKRSFSSKIDELTKAQEETRRMFVSVRDWYDLINEAEMVIDHNINEVAVKYVEAGDFLFQDQVYDNDIKASIINIQFTNYVELVGNEITGPVMIHFSSAKDRMEQNPQNIRVMQRTLMECKRHEKVCFGGQMMISCYHIGCHSTIGETYEKMCRWARKHNYVVGDDAFERYVTDYWTTTNRALHVTEVLMDVSRG
ncbi:MAG: MerR family transcriptional regulator [Desulfobacterales bacterium]|nr:MerR family transcriptional regulator [Desulfobacterales bacterium]